MPTMLSFSLWVSYPGIETRMVVCGNNPEKETLGHLSPTPNHVNPLAILKGHMVKHFFKGQNLVATQSSAGSFNVSSSIRAGIRLHKS